MEKKAIRIKYKARRSELSEQERSKLSDLLLIQFQSLHLEVPIMVASYKALVTTGEADLQAIERYCQFKNPAVQFCYPVLDSENRRMHFKHPASDSAFAENNYGIAEPLSGTVILASHIKLMFIPLLAFDVKGHRVGFGKGFYDKYLSVCEDDLIKVGFSFFDAEKDMISDKNEFDVAMDYCVTPERIYEF